MIRRTLPVPQWSADDWRDWAEQWGLTRKQRLVLLSVMRGSRAKPVKCWQVAIDAKSTPASVRVIVHRMRALGVPITSRTGAENGGYWIGE